MSRFNPAADGSVAWLDGSADDEGIDLAGLGQLPSDRRQSVLSFFTPQHYEPNYAYPLVVWLHGPGQDQRSVAQGMANVSLRNFVAVAPRGAIAQAGRPQGCVWPEDAAGLKWAEEQVLAAIDAAQRRYRIAPAKTFLVGVDSGGTLALRFALAHPRQVAGVASLGGAVPRGRMLARLNEARGLQVLLTSGRLSRRYAPAEVCDDLRLLHSAGIYIVVRHYPTGDELPDYVWGDLNRWLMDLVCPSAVESDESQRKSCS